MQLVQSLWKYNLATMQGRWLKKRTSKQHSQTCIQKEEDALADEEKGQNTQHNKEEIVSQK